MEHDCYQSHNVASSASAAGSASASQLARPEGREKLQGTDKDEAEPPLPTVALTDAQPSKRRRIAVQARLADGSAASDDAR